MYVHGFLETSNEAKLSKWQKYSTGGVIINQIMKTETSWRYVEILILTKLYPSTT